MGTTTNTREINSEKEAIIVAFRKSVTKFNEMVNDDSKRKSLIGYISSSTGVDKAYVTEYVEEVYANIDRVDLDEVLFDNSDQEGIDLEDDDDISDE